MSRFCDAVTKMEGLSADDCRRGMVALGTHSRKIHVNDSQQLSGSVNLDAALRDRFPNDPRWDYCIGYCMDGGEAAFWVEVHPAQTANVGEMLAKLAWLKAKIEAVPDLAALTNRATKPFCWVATGSISISQNSPQARRLATSGLQKPSKHLYLP
ncbi:MAG TPA: hypothetical protein ENJ79_02645 [Gammaproteobacteria bacterium]|nr:hypothetical protein [Gammaproteobacteria bacterium]